MTKLDALQNLLAKVEAGDASWSADFMGEERNTIVLAAWNGSLDAAKALHEAALPEYRYSIDSEAECVCVLDYALENAQVGEHANPARAWLIAIIKALIAMEERD